MNCSPSSWHDLYIPSMTHVLLFLQQVTLRLFLPHKSCCLSSCDNVACWNCTLSPLILTPSILWPEMSYYVSGTFTLQWPWMWTWPWPTYLNDLRWCDLSGACSLWSYVGLCLFPAMAVGCRKGYQGIDEDDPFLPRPDNASPSYYRYGSLPSRPNSIHDDSSWVPRFCCYFGGPVWPVYTIIHVCVP